MKLFKTLSNSECILVTDAIYDEMLKTEEIDIEIFKSFMAVLSCESMLDQAAKQIKKILASKIEAKMLPLITELKSKLSISQGKEEIEDYIKKNTNLSNAAKVTEELMR